MYCNQNKQEFKKVYKQFLNRSHGDNQKYDCFFTILILHTFGTFIVLATSILFCNVLKKFLLKMKNKMDVLHEKVQIIPIFKKKHKK